MCDYSLENVKTRPAEVGDTLTTREFRSGTRGFASSEDRKVAVCLLPGTRSWRSQTKLGAYVCGRGARTLSNTRPQSSGKSIKTTVT